MLKNARGRGIALAHRQMASMGLAGSRRTRLRIGLASHGSAASLKR